MNEFKKDEIDFQNLGFSYMKTDFSYRSFYKDGAWDEGVLTTNDQITLHSSSTALHYGQQAFEGLKAYRRKDGTIQLFRPAQNALRFQDSCRRLLMPEVPAVKFIDAIVKTVKANEQFVPPYESKATLYIRPYIIGIGPNLGVRPAKEYLFGVFCSPVGPYFKGGLTPVNFIVSEFDRAAPMGTGQVKVGGNYAASLYPHEIAKEKGFADCIYLDPKTHKKIEEVGAANFFGITHDNHFVTPISESILPSITKKSLQFLAEHQLGLRVEERDVYIDRLDEFKEAGACGTAAVITPIGGISYNDHLHIFHSETEVGPITKKLYEILTGIQFGTHPSPNGWIVEINDHK